MGAPGVPASSSVSPPVTIQYESVGHYNTAYVVALAAGMSDTDADELAYWAQLPDLDHRFDAIRGMLYWHLGYPIQTYLHSLRGGDPAPVRGSLEHRLADLMKEERRPRWKEGLLVHALGDAYAHTHKPFFSDASDEVLFHWPYGHLFHGHEPDKIANDRPKYFRYVEALYAALAPPHEPPTRCLVDHLKELVSCQEWSRGTNEVAAINCFGDGQRLPERREPQLALTLTRQAVDEWIEELRADR
jgi:hypothetical protein